MSTNSDGSLQIYDNFDKQGYSLGTNSADPRFDGSYRRVAAG